MDTVLQCHHSQNEHRSLLCFSLSFFSELKVGIGDQVDVFYKTSHAPGVIHSQSDLLWLAMNCGDQNKSRHDLWMLFPVFYGPSEC